MFGKIFKILINAILVLLIFIGLLVLFSFVPFPGNYKVFTVQSGSMEPAIHTGSLIFVKPSTDYNIDDIITRRTEDPKITVTHRLVSKEEQQGQTIFETKGDANDAPDGEKFGQEAIVGKVLWSLPLIGYPVSYAKTSQGIILIVVIPAVIIIYDELNKIKEEVKKKLQQRKKPDEGKEPEAS